MNTASHPFKTLYLRSLSISLSHTHTLSLSSLSLLVPDSSSISLILFHLSVYACVSGCDLDFLLSLNVLGSLHIAVPSLEMI